jgi:hypothetical protein
MVKNRVEILELDDPRAIAINAGRLIASEMLEPQIRGRIGAAQAARYHVPDRCRLSTIDRIAAAPVGWRP